MKRFQVVALFGALTMVMGNAALAQTPLPAEIHVDDETVPPGGTVQLKFSLTEPRPIIIGTKFSDMASSIDELFGVSLHSPAGDVFGVAQYQGGKFSVTYISPLGSYGTATDYPILTVTAHVRNDAVVGMRYSVAASPNSFYGDALGQIFPFVEPKAGVLTIGDSMAVHNVVPGGGLWPAGTKIRVLGMGFTRDTKIKAKFKTRDTIFVNAGEIDLVLDRAARMDAQPIEVENPRGGKHTYYSYLRPTEIGSSANPLVAAAETVFPVNAVQRVSVVQGMRGLNNTVETALAIQNSNPGRVTVVLTAKEPLAPPVQKNVTLNFGEKIARTLSEFFGTQLAQGTVVSVSASDAVQFVPFYADSVSGWLTPFVPLPY